MPICPIDKILNHVNFDILNSPVYPGTNLVGCLSLPSSLYHPLQSSSGFCFQSTHYESPRVSVPCCETGRCCFAPNSMRSSSADVHLEMMLIGIMKWNKLPKGMSLTKDRVSVSSSSASSKSALMNPAGDSNQLVSLSSSCLTSNEAMNLSSSCGGADPSSRRSSMQFVSAVMNSVSGQSAQLADAHSSSFYLMENSRSFSRFGHAQSNTRQSAGTSGNGSNHGSSAASTESLLSASAVFDGQDPESIFRQNSNSNSLYSRFSLLNNFIEDSGSGYQDHLVPSGGFVEPLIFPYSKRDFVLTANMVPHKISTVLKKQKAKASWKFCDRSRNMQISKRQQLKRSASAEMNLLFSNSFGSHSSDLDFLNLPMRTARKKSRTFMSALRFANRTSLNMKKMMIFAPKGTTSDRSPNLRGIPSRENSAADRTASVDSRALSSANTLSTKKMSARFLDSGFSPPEGGSSFQERKTNSYIDKLCKLYDTATSRLMCASRPLRLGLCSASLSQFEENRSASSTELTFSIPLPPHLPPSTYEPTLSYDYFIAVQLNISDAESQIVYDHHHAESGGTSKSQPNKSITKVYPVHIASSPFSLCSQYGVLSSMLLFKPWTRYVLPAPPIYPPVPDGFLSQFSLNLFLEVGGGIGSPFASPKALNMVVWGIKQAELELTRNSSKDHDSLSPYYEYLSWVSSISRKFGPQGQHGAPDLATQPLTKTTSPTSSHSSCRFGDLNSATVLRQFLTTAEWKEVSSVLKEGVTDALETIGWPDNDERQDSDTAVDDKEALLNGISQELDPTLLETEKVDKLNVCEMNELKDESDVANNNPAEETRDKKTGGNETKSETRPPDTTVSQTHQLKTAETAPLECEGTSSSMLNLNKSDDKQKEENINSNIKQRDTSAIIEPDCDFYPFKNKQLFYCSLFKPSSLPLCISNYLTFLRSWRDKTRIVDIFNDNRHSGLGCLFDSPFLEAEEEMDAQYKLAGASNPAPASSSDIFRTTSSNLNQRQFTSSMDSGGQSLSGATYASRGQGPRGNGRVDPHAIDSATANQLFGFISSYQATLLQEMCSPLCASNAVHRETPAMNFRITLAVELVCTVCLSGVYVFLSPQEIESRFIPYISITQDSSSTLALMGCQPQHDSSPI